jgi:hypothetical protein
MNTRPGANMMMSKKGGRSKMEKKVHTHLALPTSSVLPASVRKVPIPRLRSRRGKRYYGSTVYPSYHEEGWMAQRMVCGTAQLLLVCRICIVLSLFARRVGCGRTEEKVPATTVA